MLSSEELTANKWQPQQWQPLGLKLGTQVHLWNLLTKVYRCWGVDHFILKLIFKGLQNLKKGEIIGNCSNPNKQRNVAAYFIIHYSIRNIKERARGPPLVTCAGRWMAFLYFYSAQRPVLLDQCWDHSMTSHGGQIIFYSEPGQFWSGMLRSAAPDTMS